MSDAMSPLHIETSPFTPRLATMHEEGEENEDTGIDNITNESSENEEQKIVYLKSEDLKDENDFLQEERSLETILQPYVSQRFSYKFFVTQTSPQTWLLKPCFSSFIHKNIFKHLIFYSKAFTVNNLI